MQLINIMQTMMQSFVRITIRKTTLAFLGTGLALLIAGLSLGSAGVIPAYLGAIMMLAGYVISWRKPRHYLILALVSLICFPLGVLLHNVFYALNELYGHILVLHGMFEFLHAAFFVLAVVVSPVGLCIGIVGWVVTKVLTYRNKGLDS